MNYKNYIGLIVLFFLLSACGITKKISDFKEKTKEKLEKSVGIDEEQRERLMKTGKSANGEITKVEDTNITFNKNPVVNLYIHVKPENGEEFDAVVKTVVSRVQVPRKGDAVKVWYDPNNKEDIIVE
jgi:Protein of unknown function (DUF3592)